MPRREEPRSGAHELEGGREPVPAVDLAAVLAAEGREELVAGERARELGLLRPAVDVGADRVRRERREGVGILRERRAGLAGPGVGPAVRVASERGLERRAVAATGPEDDRQVDARRGLPAAALRAGRVRAPLGAAADGEERAQCGEEKEEASSSVRRAISTSRSVIARFTCVHQRTVTAFQLIEISGWWFAASAASARRPTKATASAKSWKR